MHSLVRVVSAAAACLVVFIAATGALADTRVALVIGNGAYRSPVMPQLPNPPRDAAALGATLTGLGFDVEVMTDASKEAMEDALARLARKSRDADITLLFYAGHGIQEQGANYLAPVDATLADETDLKRRFVRLDDALDYLADAKGARIVLLDACRDNGAVEALRAAAPKSRAAGITRGLARVPSVDGQLIAFATQPDRVAADGNGTNSPFTTALIAHLGEPGTELRTALTRVRVEVAEATDSTQIPEVSDSLLGEVYLGGAPGESRTAPAPAPAPAVDADALFWQSIQASDRQADFRAYLKAFPEGVFAPLARARLAALQPAPPPAPEPVAPAPALPVPHAAGETCATRAGPAGADTYCVSSVLPSQHGNAYGAKNLYDDRKATAWVPENRPTSVGQWVTIRFDGPRAVASLSIDNGYQKNADIFGKNSRVRSLEARFSDGSRMAVTLADRDGTQTFAVDPPIRAEWVQLVIGDIYRGRKYADTGVSQILVGSTAAP